MHQNARIYVAGHRGLVGSALVRALAGRGHDQLILRTREELDLMDTAAVDAFFARERPDIVYLAAARVGGILANSTYPVEFLRENMIIQLNVLEAAYRSGVRKLMLLGSSCIYPRLAAQPIQESALLSGPLEPTNEPYAMSKISGIKLCEAYNREYGTDFISVMPTNLYGPGDRYDLSASHVIPALIMKFHDAKRLGDDTVTVWGSGSPRREFLFVDDLADACLFLMETYTGSDIVNIGTGEDLSIAEVAEMVRETVGCNARIVFDTAKPDGTPRKLLDVRRLNAMGWKAKTPLREGLQRAYTAFAEERGITPLPGLAVTGGRRPTPIGPVPAPVP